MDEKFEIPVWRQNVFDAKYYAIAAGATLVVDVDPLPDYHVITCLSTENVVVSYGPYREGSGVLLNRSSVRMPGRSNTLFLTNLGSGSANVSVIHVTGFEDVEVMVR